MNCPKCNSSRILNIRARAKDMHSYVMVNNQEQWSEGYGAVFSPDSDTTELDICLNCGQVQGTFPMDPLYFEPDYKE